MTTSARAVDAAASEVLRDRLRAALEPLAGLRLALVYGSLAADRLTPESDLDVAVAADRPLSWEDRSTVAGQASLATGREVDLLDLRQAHGLILREALARGRLLFCHDRGLYSYLIQRMWDEQADFQPMVDRLLHRRLTRWIGA